MYIELAFDKKMSEFFCFFAFFGFLRLRAGNSGAKTVRGTSAGEKRQTAFLLTPCLKKVNSEPFSAAIFSDAWLRIRME